MVKTAALLVVLVFALGACVDAIAPDPGRDASSACKADASSAQTAVEAYYAKNKVYPSTLGALVPGFLRTDPSGAHTVGGFTWTISYDSVTGKVTATGTACSF